MRRIAPHVRKPADGTAQMAATITTVTSLRQRRLVGEDDPVWFTLLLIAAGAIACSWSAAMWLGMANVAPTSTEWRGAISEIGDNPAPLLRGPFREWRTPRARRAENAAEDATKPPAADVARPAPGASVRAAFPLVMGMPRILRQGAKSSEPKAGPCAPDDAEATRRPCPRR
jgi:hypothetical protein